LLPPDGVEGQAGNPLGTMRIAQADKKRNNLCGEFDLCRCVMETVENSRHMARLILKLLVESTLSRNRAAWARSGTSGPGSNCC
jgi:hypothetical protein